jgi:hypothetical protein
MMMFHHSMCCCFACEHRATQQRRRALKQKKQTKRTYVINPLLHNGHLVLHDRANEQQAEQREKDADGEP